MGLRGYLVCVIFILKHFRCQAGYGMLYVTYKRRLCTVAQTPSHAHCAVMVPFASKATPYTVL